MSPAPQTPYLPPQNVPVMDRDSPTLMSTPWWIPLRKLFDAFNTLSLLDFVFGGSTLVTIGVIPKATAAGTLGGSSLTDDGSTVTGTLPLEVHFKGAGDGTAQAHLAPGNVDDGTWVMSLLVGGKPGVWISQGARYDGTNWIAKNAQATILNVDQTGSLSYTFNSGLTPGNAFTPTSIFAVDSTGNVNAAGVFKVAGTQVVGPRLAAVSAPSITTSGVAAGPAPATYTVVAQNMLDQLKAAVLALNTDVANLQTTANDLRSRLQTTGITA